MIARRNAMNAAASILENKQKDLKIKIALSQKKN